MEALPPIHFPFEKLGFALSDEKRQRYTALTLGAKEAKAYPSQSGYFVRTSGLTENGIVHKGGNKENSLSDAFIHGETAVVSALRDQTDSPIEAIAFYDPVREGKTISAHDFGCCCGACLDVLQGYCARSLALLNGNETGVIYTELENFLFNDFRQGDVSLLQHVDVQEALKAADNGVDVYLPADKQEEMYGAVLVSGSGKRWKGKHYTNAGYDAVPPVMSAVMHWNNDYPNGRISMTDLNLTKLVIASRGKMPAPLYRDRQAILELDERLRIYTGRKEPLPIELVQVTKDGEVNVQVTNASEWLPHPFTPGAFGMESVIIAELAKLVGEDEAKRAFAQR